MSDLHRKMANRSKKQRRRLWLGDPRCHWCRRPTRLLDVVGGPQPPDMATIDHLFSRLDGNRSNVSLGIGKTSRRGNKYVMRHVLACRACNSNRGCVETGLTRLREQQKRSGTTPLHERSYRERRRYLLDLKKRAERDVFGLVSVMGIMPYAGARPAYFEDG